MNEIAITPTTNTPLARRFEEKLATPFIYKSVSNETRAAYKRGIKEFFAVVGGRHPAEVTPEHVINYRDGLQARGRKPATVCTKLSIVRSFFDYLLADGIVARNPASTRFVTPPQLPTAPGGRSLTSKEVRYLLSGPDQKTTTGARDYAMIVVMVRLSLREAEVASLRASGVKWNGTRWTLTCKIKGGREEVWPLPKDVKAAIDEYLELDKDRRSILKCDGSSKGSDAYVFQPVTNYATGIFDKALSTRSIQRIVGRWADFTGIGKVTPHDLRRTVVTRLLDLGYTYREVQMVTKQKDPKTVMKYDYGRENLDKNPVNKLTYDDE